MPSDVEAQGPNVDSPERPAALMLSWLLLVLVYLMCAVNVVLIFITCVQQQFPSLAGALPRLIGTWFILAVILVVTACIYVLFFNPHSSVPFARIIVSLCLSYLGRFFHLGEVPPLLEWPTWFDVGLIFGWASNQLIHGGGIPHASYRRGQDPPIAGHENELADLPRLQNR